MGRLCSEFHYCKSKICVTNNRYQTRWIVYPTEMKVCENLKDKPFNSPSMTELRVKWKTLPILVSVQH